MKILINNDLSAELENTSNKDLVKKTYRYLAQFDQYFRTLTDFETNKIEKLKLSRSNLYVFRLDHKNRMIFTAEYDKEGELNVAILEIVKHDEYEKRNYSLLNE